MCRIIALPPRFNRLEAINILLAMEKCNTDGVGSVYVNETGEFVVEKYPTSLSSILKRKVDFLSKLETHDGWTLVHLRAASHGANALRNTHPFLVGDRAIIHNGIWNDYWVASLALSYTHTFEGETDSEVAAYMINHIGVKAFSEYIEGAGVFMSLNKTGELEIIKTSGDLELVSRRDGTFIISSEFSEKYKRRVEAYEGRYTFTKNGKYKSHVAKLTDGYGMAATVKWKKTKALGEPVKSYKFSSFGCRTFGASRHSMRGEPFMSPGFMHEVYKD
jgi:glucosamine 6-phosphate synthetase-like amidotransferase/phosphosugar isomerase protein